MWRSSNILDDSNHKNFIFEKIKSKIIPIGAYHHSVSKRVASSSAV
jgi:hypothetical protein